MTEHTDPTLSRYADAESDTLRDALLTVSPKQRAALDALATGSTHAEAAHAAKVTRETVTRWLNHHPAFRTAYAAQCSALAAEAAEQARAIRAKASAVVLAKLDGADLPTALAALRAVGPAPAPTELGTQTAPAMLDQARSATRHTSPAPPRLRGDGLDDLLGQMDGSAEVAEYERVDRLTLTRLADASGIDPDELDPPAPTRRRRRAS